MSQSKRVVFSAVKNEGPFLLEWIAYHKAIGFDAFLVVSNDSTDGTTELLNALQDVGEITHIYREQKPGQSPQGRAAIAGNAAGVIADGDYVIWLDADEFLNVHAGAGRVDDLIDALDRVNAEGMLVSWRIFGDSGVVTFPGRHISAQFVGAARFDCAENQQQKTFYRHRDKGTELSRKANHRPRLFREKDYGLDDFVNAGGQPIDPESRINRNWLRGTQGQANAKITSADFSWKIAQINHYSVRTREFFDLKKSRGRGFQNERRPDSMGRVRHDDRFFKSANRNEATDDTILRHETATGDHIAQLLTHPGVKRAYDSIMEKVAKMRAGEPVGLTDDSPNTVDAAPAETAKTEQAPPEIFVPDLTLPAAEQVLVHKYYSKADVILEYGSGGSTLMAAGMGKTLTMSVESDEAWSRNMEAVLGRDFPDANVKMQWVDIGPTRSWGRPKTGKRDNHWRGYHRYPLSVWDQPWFQQPDVVLVDGRFRVGCVLATLFRSQKPVTLLFDDYVNRPHYHWIEQFVKPCETVGRMALFNVSPIPVPVNCLGEIVTRFQDSE